jgi:multiple sugar transport system permease protein
MRVRQPSWGAQRQRSFVAGLTPALLVLALITIAPAVYLILTSLTPLNLTLPNTAWEFSSPAGNYVDLFEDPRFTRSVWVQVKLSVSTVILQLLAGLGVALLLNAARASASSPDRGFSFPWCCRLSWSAFSGA